MPTLVAPVDRRDRPKRQFNGRKRSQRPQRDAARKSGPVIKMWTDTRRTLARRWQNQKSRYCCLNAKDYFVALVLRVWTEELVENSPAALSSIGLNPRRVSSEIVAEAVRDRQ